VYAIVDRAVAGSDATFLGHLAALVAGVAADGGVWLQLRVKGVSPLVRCALLREAATLVRARPDLPVLVNGTAEEAAELHFSGVHWPGSLLPEAATAPTLRWTCAAAHDAASLRAAHRAGARVATWSPVFDARSKHAVGRGSDALRQAVATAPLPVLALGGITPANAGACIDAGAAGVAVLSTVSAPGADPAAAVRALRIAVESR
jgi:thiamine-phosphate pyrophosphorylase